MVSDRDTLTELVDLTYNQCINTRPIRSPYKAIADAVLREGWRPPPRRITEASELDALPNETVILDANEEFHRLNPYGLDASPTWFPAWLSGNAYASDFGQVPALPAVVVWTPGGEA